MLLIINFLKEDQAYISAPGAFYWGGTIVSQPLNGRSKTSFTNEPPKEYDDTYMGKITDTLTKTFKLALISDELRHLFRGRLARISKFFFYCSSNLPE